MEPLDYESFKKSMMQLTGREDLYILYKDDLPSLKSSISLVRTLSDMYSMSGMSKIIPIPGMSERLSEVGQAQTKAVIECIRIHLIADYNRHLRLDKNPEEDIEYKKYFLELVTACLFTFIFDISSGDNLITKVKNELDEEGDTIINKVNDILKKGQK